MALRERLIPWGGQPQEAVGVAWENALTTGLVFSYLPLDNNNGVTGKSPSSYLNGGLVLSVGQGGHGRISGVSSPRGTRFSGVSTPEDYTVAALVSDSAGRGVIRSLLIADDPTVLRCYQLRFNASNQPEFIVFNSGLSTFIGSSTTTTDSLKTHLVVGRLKSGVVSVWLNGQVGGTTATATGVINQPTYIDVASRVASGAAGTGNDNPLHFASAWNRALSDQEVVDFSNNPWQLFEPQRIFVPVAAGGTTISAAVGDAAAAGSTADVYQGSVVSGAVGNAVADGAVATVTTGASIAATVGDAVANGSTAAVYQGAVISAGVGTAAADGQTASVSNTSDVTINATVGNAVAAGSAATIYVGTAIGATTGNAVANGSTASVTAGGASIIPYFDVISGKLLVLRQLS